MTSLSILRGAVCGAAILSAGTAHADVTAAEVWADWQASLAMYGDDAVTIGAETMDGNTLTVSDIVVNMADDATTVAGTMGDLVFTENSDGTVTLTMDPSFSMKITAEDEVSMTMTVNHTGLVMVANGTTGDLTYDISADQYGLSVGDIAQDGDVLDATFRMIANDLEGSYTSQTGELRTTQYDMTIASLDVLADVIPPEIAGDYFTLSGRADDLTMQGIITVPTDIDMSDTASMLAEGVTMDGSYSIQSSNYLFDVLGWIS